MTCGVPEGRTWGRVSPALSSDPEGSDCGHAASPEPHESPQDLYMDLCRVEEPKALPRKVHKGQVFLDSHSRNFGDSQDQAGSSRSKEHKSSHKEKQRPGTRAEESAPTFSPERLHKGTSKETLREAPSVGGSKERLKASDSAKREKKREDLNSKKEKLLVNLDDSSGNHVKKQRHQESDRGKQEKVKLGPAASHGDREKRKLEGESSSKNKEKKASGGAKAVESNKKTVGFLPASSGDGETEEEFEKPTRSFESYLSYDQPQKKKKKVVKPSTPAPDKDRAQGKQNGSKASTKSSDVSQKAHKQASEKKQAGVSKPKKVSLTAGGSFRGKRLAQSREEW